MTYELDDRRTFTMETTGESTRDRKRPLPGYPVLIGEPMDDGVHLQVWCPWCRHFHFHGLAGGEGHCTAHCVSGPFKERGYYVVFATTAKRMDRRRP
jgi:hypothetical protein